MKLNGFRSENCRLPCYFERFSMKRGDAYVVNSRGKDSLHAWYLRGTFETMSRHCRVARQALSCHTAVARLGFKRCATTVPRYAFEGGQGGCSSEILN